MRGKPLPELAHLVLYPYANPELMYRYGKLNGSIMHTAVEPLLAEVRRPALVVTSEDDHTAHPEGSRRVAEALPGATLRVEPHGDHISLFRARGATPHLARTFLAGTGNPP
jgi:pimeloyl-ACP methyl ester carboxylesterase